MKTPLVSIIIPVYNIEQYLRRCLDSIISQTYENYEVILINDGSTDASGEVCDEYEYKDRRFRVIHQKNQGVSTARNRGVAAAKGDYFTFIDGDDWVSDKYIAHHIDIIHKFGVDLVCTKMNRVAENESFNFRITNIDDSIVLKTEEAVESLLYLENITNNVYAKLYASRIVEKLKFDSDLAIGEDMEYVFRAILSAEYVAISKATLYAYEQRPGSAMNSSLSDKTCDAYRAVKKMISNSESVIIDERALQVKLFTEAFWLALKLRRAGEKYEGIYQSCLQDIRRSAGSVWNNKRVSRSRRVYASVARFNPSIAVSLMNGILSMRRARGLFR